MASSRRRFDFEKKMKIGRALTLALAAAGLQLLAAPAHAQMRSGHRGGNPGGSSFNHGGFNRGDGFRGRGFVRRGGVNVFVGAGFFGWPFWGYPYYWGYPYGYAPYGYYYGPPVYDAPAADGVYNGRVRTNDGGKDVSLAAKVQQRLARTGYYDGPIDGIIGDGTRRAIRNYERANGLRVDGRIDNELIEAMGLG